MRPFPIPVVPAALGPGSQDDDGETLDYLPMPQDMAVYRPPVLPEPETLAAHGGAVAALQAALASLRRHLGGAAVPPIELAGLDAADRALVNQVLGEGEVSVRVTGEGGVQAQESVFAGVWRVLHTDGDRVVRDTLEVGAIPQAVTLAAQGPAPAGTDDDSGPMPAGTMNAPAILEELREARARWSPGQPPHVVNLTLLPLSPGDRALIDARLGTGRVMILSRGYGNCRIVTTGQPRTWRVSYFNSQDINILDTLEIGGVPEVACAAPEDLHDSAQRLAEVLQWVAEGQAR